NILCIIETSVSDITHEAQHGIEVFTIDVVLFFQPFADQTQNFQSAEHNLMLSGACRSLHGKTSRVGCYIVFETLMPGKDSSRCSLLQGFFVISCSVAIIEQVKQEGGRVSTTLNSQAPTTERESSSKEHKPPFPGIPTTSDGAGMVVWVETHIT